MTDDLDELNLRRYYPEDDGVLAVTARLPCGHPIEVSELSPGFENASMPALEESLRRRIRFHDCDAYDRIKDMPPFGWHRPDVTAAIAEASGLFAGQVAYDATVEEIAAAYAANPYGITFNGPPRADGGVYRPGRTANRLPGLTLIGYGAILGLLAGFAVIFAWGLVETIRQAGYGGPLILSLASLTGAAWGIRERLRR